MEVLEGDSNITIENWSSYVRDFKVNVNQSSIIKIRTYYYPAWNLRINDKIQDIKILEDGTMGFSLERGTYQGNLTYELTPVFKWGILLTILSLILGLIFHIILDNYPFRLKNKSDGK